MQLPEQLHPFHVPTLIVVTDHVQAKLFLATDREIDLLETFSTKSENTDSDHHVVARGSGELSSSAGEDNRQAWSREQLYEKLNVDLMLRLKKGQFEALAFTVPHDCVNVLKESLHIDLLKRAKAFVPKLLTNDDLLDIVAHVQQEEM